MTVTLDDLVEYSQGIDARLATLDVDKLKDKIRYGVNNLATQELCFSIPRNDGSVHLLYHRS
jgi:hypothetical protein